MKTSHSFILVALVLLIIIWGITIPCGTYFNWNPIIYISCAAAISILVVLASCKGYKLRKQVIVIHKVGARQINSGAKPCPAASYIYQTRDCYNGKLTNEALKWVHPDSNAGCYNMSELLHNKEADSCSRMPITTQADLDLVDETHPMMALKMIALALIGKTESAVRKGEARLVQAAEESRARLRAKVEPLTSAVSTAVNDRVNQANQLIEDTKTQITTGIDRMGDSIGMNNASNWLHGDEPNVNMREESTTAADEFTINNSIDDEPQFEPTITNAAQEFGISDDITDFNAQEVEEEMAPTNDANGDSDDQNELNIDRLFEVEEKPAAKHKQSEWDYTLE